MKKSFGFRTLHLLIALMLTFAIGSTFVGTLPAMAAGMTTALPSHVYVDASWAGTAAGADPDGTGPATSFGGDAFDTIQGGVSAVEAAGAVDVAAGTYNETLITIDKSLTLTGAGAATTIIDGGGVATAGHDGLVKITGALGPVTLQGFTLQNAGGDTAGTISLVLIDHDSAAAPVTIQNNHFIGRNNGDLWDMGLWSYSTDGALTIQNNEFDHMWQGILLERPRGGASVLTNSLHDLKSATDTGTLYEAEGLFAFTYSGDSVSSPMVLNGNTFTGYNGSDIALSGGYSGHTAAQFTNVEIKDNTLNAIGGSGLERRHVGIYLINFGSTPADAASGGIPNAVISGNHITGNITAGSTESYGIRLSGPNNNLTITNNEISGLNNGIATDEKIAGAGFPQGITAHGNTFTGNTAAVVNGSSVPADVINALDNWWGTALGPTHTSNPTGTGDVVSNNVDYSPWSATALCTTFVPPFATTTTITSDLPDSSLPGQSVIINFSVANNVTGGPVPTGTVDISDGATVICNDMALASSGNGSCSSAFSTSGLHTLVATFAPTSTASFQASTGTATHMVTIVANLRSTAIYDGGILESGEFSNVGSSLYATGTTFNLGDDAANRQYRAILSFNTAGLPDNAVLTSVTLKIMKAGQAGANPFLTLGNITADIRKGSFGLGSLQAADFQALASKNGVLTFTNTPAGGWYTKALAATNFSFVNKVGTTQFRLRFTKDDNNNHVADYLKFYSGNAASVATQPVLVIQYYLP